MNYDSLHLRLTYRAFVNFYKSAADREQHSTSVIYGGHHGEPGRSMFMILLTDQHSYVI